MSQPGPRRARHAAPTAADVGRSSSTEVPPSRRYSGRSIARHGRLNVTTPARSIAKGVSLVASVLVLSLVVLGAITWVRLWGNLGDQPSLGDPSVPPLAQIEGGANVLVIGSDSRAGQGAEFGEGLEEASGVLNDVNILFHLSEDQTHATAVSIPRDTIVNTPECVNDKGDTIPAQEGVPFNSILQEGGISCVVAAAEQLSGLDVQYAAMVQFRGVIEMSNAVGGVDVCVANEISDDYVGLYLQPGMHSLKGEDALKFLRSRHGVGDGSDLSRISNQQVFLAALIREVKSSDTLTNPASLYGLGVAVTRNMTLSSSLNLDTILGFATALSRIPTENIVFASLPVGDGWEAGKVEPLEPDATLMWDRLRQDQPLELAPPATVPTEGAATADPAATEAPPIDTSTPVATDGATPVPTVLGQTASDETCSNVN